MRDAPETVECYFESNTTAATSRALDNQHVSFREREEFPLNRAEFHLEDVRQIQTARGNVCAPQVLSFWITPTPGRRFLRTELNSPGLTDRDF
jgi:hypothetical protein